MVVMLDNWKALSTADYLAYPSVDPSVEMWGYSPVVMKVGKMEKIRRKTSSCLYQLVSTNKWTIFG